MIYCIKLNGNFFCKSGLIKHTAPLEIIKILTYFNCHGYTKASQSQENQRAIYTCKLIKHKVMIICQALRLSKYAKSLRFALSSSHNKEIALKYLLLIMLASILTVTELYADNDARPSTITWVNRHYYQKYFRYDTIAIVPCSHPVDLFNPAILLFGQNQFGPGRLQALSVPPAIAPSPGDGSEANPYHISSLGNLYWIAENLSRWGYHYIQTSDIDASETSNWFNGQGWPPIGYYNSDDDFYPFTGSYNGQGHTINGLYIYRPDLSHVGLFGHTYMATISNLGVTNVAVSGNESVGGLVGVNYCHSDVVNCFSTGHVAGNEVIGGLVGNNIISNIINSYSTANVSGTDIGAGGLAGISAQASVASSYSTGTIEGIECVGGLIGANYMSPVSDSYSKSNVDGEYAVGGLIGTDLDSEVSNSYSSGAVYGIFYVGGLIGDIWDGWDTTVINSYWNTQTSGQESSAGGDGRTTEEMTFPHAENTYVGWDFYETWAIGPYVFDAYPYLLWQLAEEPVLPKPCDLVAVAGDGVVELSWSAPETNKHSDKKTDATPNTFFGYNVYRNDTLLNIVAPDTESYTDSDVENHVTYTYYVTALYDEGESDASNIVQATPGMTATPPSAGDGSEENPYEIANLENLYWIAADKNRWGYHYIQVAHIDAAATAIWFEGRGWKPIGNGSSQFSGSYNGQNHHIEGLYIDRNDEDNIGLFGQCFGAELTNTALLNVNVNGEKKVGSLAGSVFQTDIKNAYSSGNVYGFEVVGGLLGNTSFSSIAASHSSADVEGVHTVGGLVGSNFANMDNCYSLGTVTASGNYVGGLAGSISKSALYDCYSHGLITGHSRVGGLVGRSFDSQLYHCYSTGIVNGNSNVGGLAGVLSSSQAFYSNTTAEVTGYENVGGLAGQSSHSYVKASHSSNNITGNTAVGGLIGTNNESTVGHSFSNSNVSATGSSAGGLIGISTSGVVYNSYSNGSVHGVLTVGGLIGSASLTQINRCFSTTNVTGDHVLGGLLGSTGVGVTINDCYSTGSVQGIDLVGGLVSHLEHSDINNSYATGWVSGDTNTGGLIVSRGFFSPTTITNSYWNIETTGQTESAGGDGRTTEEMCFPAAGNTYVEWNFSEVWTHDTEHDTNNGYPFHLWQHHTTPASVEPPAGEGTTDDPFLIATLENLYWITENDSRWAYHYMQVADIDALETNRWFSLHEGWPPIGNCHMPFTGSYNGQGYRIDSLHIYRPVQNCIGLFGHTSEALIKNIYLHNASIHGGKYVGAAVGRLAWHSVLQKTKASGSINAENRVGGLTGLNSMHTIVQQSTFSGTVNGEFYVGGLTGEIALSSNLSECHSQGTVTGDSRVGGLTGNASGASHIEKSYSTSSVIATGGMVGGLVGYNDSSDITACYSSGQVIALHSKGTGGLVGFNYGAAVTNSFSNSMVQGKNMVGGLVGANLWNATVNGCYSTGNIDASGEEIGGLVGANSSYSEILNSFGTGNVTGNKNTGGLVGNNAHHAIIENSYSNGAVSGNEFIGGLVGSSGLFGNDNTGTAINSYWDTETSGQDSSAAGQGRTSAEMTHPHTANTYVDWDFESIWSADAGFTENNGYPFLELDEADATRYHLSLYSIPANGGLLTGGGFYAEHDAVSLAAIANPNFGFENWTNANGQEVSDQDVFMFVMPAEDVVLWANFSEDSIPDHRTLSDIIITADDQGLCFDAFMSIALSDILIESGGEVLLIAGERIRLLPGTKVKSGGYLHAYITQTDTFCPVPSASKTDEGVTADLYYTGADSQSNFFTIYPNPTGGVFTLEFKKLLPGQHFFLKVYGMPGERIFSRQLPNQEFHTFDLTRQKPGIYIIRLTKGEQVGVERLIKR